MNAGFTRDVAFEYCAEFWKTELWEWVKSELGSNSLAPEIVIE